MTSIVEVITILRNRIDFLTASRIPAVAAGDLAAVDRIDREILETLETLAKLES